MLSQIIFFLILNCLKEGRLFLIIS